jgi:hypothetical protein
MQKQARATGANARFAHCDQVQKLDTAPESKAQWDVHKITRSLLQYQQYRGPRERSTASPQISEVMGDATNLVQVRVKEKAKNIAPFAVRLFPLFPDITFFCQCTQSPYQIIFLILQSSYCFFPTSLPIIVHCNDNGKPSFVPLSLSQFCHLPLVPYLLHSLISLRLLFNTFIPCSKSQVSTLPQYILKTFDAGRHDTHNDHDTRPRHYIRSTQCGSRHAPLRNYRTHRFRLTYLRRYYTCSA